MWSVRKEVGSKMRWEKIKFRVAHISSSQFCKNQTYRSGLGHASILVVAGHVFKWNCQFWRSCLEAAASDQVCCRRRFLKCVTRPAASQGTVICHYHIVLNHNFITREVNILKSMISMKSQKISSLTILYMTILYMTTFCHRKCTKNVPRYLKCKPIRYIIGLLCLG